MTFLKAMSAIRLGIAIRALKISAMFDANIDNNGTGLIKEDGLLEIIDDYNRKYNKY